MRAIIILAALTVLAAGCASEQRQSNADLDLKASQELTNSMKNAKAKTDPAAQPATP